MEISGALSLENLTKDIADL